jgi:hypothetical protein
MSRSEGLNRAEELSRELEQPKTAECGTERPSKVAEQMNGRSAESQSADIAVRQVGCREALACFGNRSAGVQNRAAEPSGRAQKWPCAEMAERRSDRRLGRPMNGATEEQSIQRLGHPRTEEGT